MRISDWSSDVCSSDLRSRDAHRARRCADGCLDFARHGRDVGMFATDRWRSNPAFYEIRAEIAENAEALVPCRECRSDLFRAKPQRHEDVVLAAKRLFRSRCARSHRWKEKRPCGREPAFSCLCGFVRHEKSEQKSVG